ncbi:MAG: hypothetical protein JWQ09_5896 [Segetibacter sp.]|nr:hypothetical protein [Segetibacter sp.]
MVFKKEQEGCMMQLINDVELIGDLLNTIPVMIELSIINNGLEVKHIGEKSKWIYPLIPKKYNINLVDIVDNNAIKIDMLTAFDSSQILNSHMSISYHAQFGLPVPTNPIKPELEFEVLPVPVYDYILCPHSRSLTDKEKWDAEKWIELAQELEEKGYSVCFFGSSLYDKEFIGFNNEYDRPMVEVLNMIKACNEGIISVVTGISHLCYAVGAKNYVMCNQLNKWGLNPSAVHIKKYIPELTVDEVLEVLCVE